MNKAGVSIIATALLFFVGNSAEHLGTRKLGNDDDGSISNYVSVTLSNLQQLMVNGNPSLDIPVMDPLNATGWTVDKVPDGFETFKAVFQETSITGLSSFTFDSVDAEFAALQLDVNLHYQPISLLGVASLTGSVNDSYSIDKTGQLGITASEGSFKVSVWFIKVNSTIQIDRLAVDYTFGQVDTTFDGNVEPNLVTAIGNDVVDALVTELISSSQAWLQEKVNPILAYFDFTNAIPTNSLIDKFLDGFGM